MQENAGYGPSCPALPIIAYSGPVLHEKTIDALTPSADHLSSGLRSAIALPNSYKILQDSTGMYRICTGSYRRLQMSTAFYSHSKAALLAFAYFCMLLLCSEAMLKTELTHANPIMLLIPYFKIDWVIGIYLVLRFKDFKIFKSSELGLSDAFSAMKISWASHGLPMSPYYPPILPLHV